MKCILLCAGYATRLFPLTKNFPKALIKVGKKPILDYILDEVNTIDEVDDIILVTNNRYYEHFKFWADSKNNKKKLEIINDKTISNDDRLGAIGDIMYVIDQKKINDDLLIICGDNLFTYPLKNVVDYYHEKKKSIVCVKEMDDLDEIKRFAVAKVDNNNKIIDLVEKPENPQSNIAVYATYIYPKEILNYFNEYKQAGNNLDAPGRFPQYLYDKEDIYAYFFSGECYDVGTHETLKEVNELFK